LACQLTLPLAIFNDLEHDMNMAVELSVELIAVLFLALHLVGLFLYTVWWQVPAKPQIVVTS
jgi:hypothetical protein